MVYRGLEVLAKLDYKFRLIIPDEIVKSKKLKGKVFLVNVLVDGHQLTRIYYRKPRTNRALEIDLEKTKCSRRVTIIKSIRSESSSFLYDRSVMIVDGGDFLEILPWPAI